MLKLFVGYSSVLYWHTECRRTAAGLAGFTASWPQSARGSRSDILGIDHVGRQAFTSLYSSPNGATDGPRK